MSLFVECDFWVAPCVSLFVECDFWVALGDFEGFQFSDRQTRNKINQDISFTFKFPTDWGVCGLPLIILPYRLRKNKPRFLQS